MARSRRPLVTSPGFYPQPNKWTCGPYALKHALVALGRPVDAHELAAMAKTHWWSGTNEIQLAHAAHEHECDLVLERSSDAEVSRRRLASYMRRKIPVLLCVDRWEHWITVVGYDGHRFVIIDSLLDAVLDLIPWTELRRRWGYRDARHRKVSGVVYDSLAVEPRFRTTVTADFSVDRVKVLRRAANRPLARHWNEYLEDLLDICRPPSTRMLSPLSMSELLRRHQDMLVARVVFWHGDVKRRDVEKVLGHLRFVSETYGLVVPAAEARRAVADLAIIATMWATTVSPVNELYGDRRRAGKKVSKRR